jgi:pimeloyl-ACP methyl ester carboxylesterase
MNFRHYVIRLLGAPIFAVALGSCGLAPATFERIHQSVKADEKPEANLQYLIARSVENHDSTESVMALGEFVELWKRHGYRSGHSFVSPSGSTTYRVHLVNHASGEYGIDHFDELLPARHYRIRKITHHQRAGVGTPLVAIRENRHREAIEGYYPPEAITRPLTAVATIGPSQGSVREVTIQLLCPLANDRVKIDGQTRPLAADFSAPWAALLARSGELNRSAVLDMLTPNPKRVPQLYLMEPYDRQKEPLIMIHGLLSTPLAWAGVSNDLWADDGIRRRYQIWHFHYNTSAPALYSARILRGRLRELRALLDPDGDDPAMRKTTILAHSMGGLIAKALVVQPRDAFWKAAFNVPPGKLVLSAKDREALNDAFEWKSDPSVHRIIYVAVPHRGSNFADNPVGYLGRLLTSVPQPFQEFYSRVSAANPGAFTPAYAQLGSGKLSSVSSLSPRQPTLRILADLPYAKPVKTHSIIGNRGKSGPLTNSSDGIVPYTSSHLEDTASELVVPAGHGAFHHPAAIAEIQRLLNLPP